MASPCPLWLAWDFFGFGFTILYTTVMQLFWVVYHAWNIPRVSCIFSVRTGDFRRECILRNYEQQERYSMVNNERALHNCFITVHGVENNWLTQSRAVRDWKVGCNTIEYTAGFLYSDWLYFPWYSINSHINDRVAVLRYWTWFSSQFIITGEDHWLFTQRKKTKENITFAN